MFRHKRDRYEYYALRKGFYADPEPGVTFTKNSGEVMSAFGNLGSQGWRYVDTIGDFYIFERVNRW